MDIDIINTINKNRIKNNFLTIDEIISKICSENTVFDELSLLINRNVTIGKNNIFYPNVIINAENDSHVSIGNNNMFGNGTTIYTEEKQEMIIGSNCRFDGKINLYGNCNIGDGTQILGFIQVYNCTLQQGNSYKEMDPNLRGAVLKGTGRAKDLKIKKGYVINGSGDFKQELEEPQINYHK